MRSVCPEPTGQKHPSHTLLLPFSQRHAAELVVEALSYLLSCCAGDGVEAGDGDEAGDEQAGNEQEQDRQTAALSKQYGLVDGDVVSATAAYCNERKLAAKTVSVRVCASIQQRYMWVVSAFVDAQVWAPLPCVNYLMPQCV